MKYTVTYACGHTGEVQLFGKNEDREKKIHYLEKYGLCETCNEKEQETEWNQYETEKNLPLLTGSEKQVKWARKLRFVCLPGIQDALVKFQVPDNTAKECLAYYAEKDSASWWIEHRDTTFRILVQDFLRNVYLPAHPELQKK